jgi:hypothetical protein
VYALYNLYYGIIVLVKCFVIYLFCPISVSVLMEVNMSIIDPANEDAKTYVESYLSFARTLRTWLVAYGIGAPVLLASQEAFSTVFKNKEVVILIIHAYLVGVCLQIFSAILYKASMWYIMWGALKETFKSSRRYKFSDWVSEQLWIELFFDIASISLFAWATLRILVELAV